MSFKPSRSSLSRSRARTLLRTRDASAKAATPPAVALLEAALPPVVGNKAAGKQQDRAEYAAPKELIRRKDEASAHRLQEMIRRNKEYWNKR